MARSCLLLGATGLVGGHLLDLLRANPEYGRIVALVRRPLGLADPRVHEVLADLGRPETYREHVAVDDVYCCLGTTLKKAGSREAFRKVDHDYPLAVAQAAREAGAERFVIVTSVGADPRSGIFYNRVKGEVEAELAKLDFPGGLKVVRPSMLLGARTEARPAERVGGALMSATAPLFRGPLARYRAIDARDVARAMFAAGLREPSGARVYEGTKLFALVARTSAP